MLLKVYFSQQHLYHLYACLTIINDTNQSNLCSTDEHDSSVMCNFCVFHTRSLYIGLVSYYGSPINAVRDFGWLFPDSATICHAIFLQLIALSDVVQFPQ